MNETPSDKFAALTTQMEEARSDARDLEAKHEQLIEDHTRDGLTRQQLVVLTNALLLGRSLCCTEDTLRDVFPSDPIWRDKLSGWAYDKIGCNPNTVGRRKSWTYTFWRDFAGGSRIRLDSGNWCVQCSCGWSTTGKLDECSELVEGRYVEHVLREHELPPRG